MGDFWPEISALGVFLNFDNERMYPPKYRSDPRNHDHSCFFAKSTQQIKKSIDLQSKLPSVLYLTRTDAFNSFVPVTH